MNKTIKYLVKNCMILILVLILSMGPSLSFAADIKANKSVNDYMNTPVLTKPVPPPTLTDVLLNETGNMAISPTSTIGGSIVGAGMDFVGNRIGDPDTIKAGAAKAQKQLTRLIKSRGNSLKSMTKLKSGSKASNRVLKVLNKNASKIANNENIIKGSSSKLRKLKGLKLAGTAMTIYGIYSDSDALLKGEYKHKHTSVRFVRDSLLGSNIAINGFLLTPWGQVPVIKQGGELFALGLGVTKDFVTSDTFVKYMNSQNNRVLKFSDEVIDNTNEYWTDTFESWITKWYKYTGVRPKDGEVTMAGVEHSLWLEYQKQGLGRKPGDNVGAYKPNIYLYPEEETSITVTFDMPGLLERVIPDYKDKWQVTAYADGRIIDHDGEMYSYLFYESMTWPFLYQVEEGWFIKAESRSEQIESIMFSYGFTTDETADFVEYWTKKLDPGVDYAMYPQLNHIVDIAMPINIEPKPDNLFRLWFAFEKQGVPTKISTPEYIIRDGFTAVEWGGVILP